MAKKDEKKSSNIIGTFVSGVCSSSIGCCGGFFGVSFLSVFIILILSIIIGFVLFLIFLPFCLHTVRYDTFGLVYNRITTTVGSDVREPGMHFLGIFYNFIPIPSVYKTIQFGSLESRTKDGLTVKLDVSFQYRINKTDISIVFEKFGLSYEKTVEKFASQTIRDVASGFNAIEFFQNRSSVAEKMESEMRLTIAKIDIHIGFFQLRKVDLPDNYEQIIEQNEIQIQKIPKAKFDQQVELVQAQTEVYVSEKEAQIVKINAIASANIIQIQTDANVNKTMEEVAGLTSAYSNLKSTLSLSEEQLSTYSWVDLVKDLNSQNLLISLEKPSSLTFN